MDSVLSQLLFKETPKPTERGRVIRFGVEEPDIQLATGSMSERVMAYLQRNALPATAKEVAAAIGSNGSRVTRVLLQLVKDQKIKAIKIEGCVAEYELA